MDESVLANTFVSSLAYGKGVRKLDSQLRGLHLVLFFTILNEYYLEAATLGFLIYLDTYTLW